MRCSERPVIAIAGPGWSIAISALTLVEQAAAGPRVVAAEDGQPADWLVCFGDVPDGTVTDLPTSRRLIVISEPPGILRYRPGFLAQFGVAISPFALPGFAGLRIASHPAIPWFYGCRFGGGKPASWRYSADELLAMAPAPKANVISAVLSRKTMTPMHAARLRCVEALERAFSGCVRLYGSGFQPIDDKAEAIDAALFHLALENTRHADYWTEKFADSLLGWALPVYDGAPNIGNYFDMASFRTIDVSDVDGTIRCIGALLEAGESGLQHAAIATARETLLREHSLVALLRRVVAGLPAEASTQSKVQPLRLRSNHEFSLKARLLRQSGLNRYI